ncbi:MAG: 2-oxo acid dehydrogenase subunit E2 [Acidobacteria bacterium]|nr:2-oxo acid dehydrogenase subunit E2 [Acidobacteriota bacterium]
MYEFKLPDLGEGIHEGELLKWHVQPGESIREDDPLVDVETDKAAVTIPSPRGGKVVSVAGGAGDTVKVGQVLAVIEDAAAPGPAPEQTRATRDVPAAKAPRPQDLPPSPPAPAKSTAKPAAPAPRPAAQPVPERGSAAAPAPVAAASSGPVVAAPATRRLAREMGIDLKLVAGSGPAGRITPEDVRQFAAGRPAAGTPEVEDEEPAAPATIGGGASPIPFYELEQLPDFSQWGPVEREPVRSIRRKTARKMVTSMVLVPHVTHMDEADVTELDEFRRRERERRSGKPGEKLSLLPFAVKAVAAVLEQFPMLNASIDPQREEIVYKKYYNIGIALDTPKGLMVPVIKDADRKTILEIAIEIEQLALRGRAGAIDVGDLRGGTFTITNVGSIGGTGLIPTINYPEVAILGMGRAAKRPVVQDDDLAIRTMLPLTLTFDHRIADGAGAARFMNELVRRLSEPLAWLLEF